MLNRKEPSFLSACFPSRQLIPPDLKALKAPPQGDKAGQPLARNLLRRGFSFERPGCSVGLSATCFLSVRGAAR